MKLMLLGLSQGKFMKKYVSGWPQKNKSDGLFLQKKILVIFKSVLISLLHPWNGCFWDFVQSRFMKRWPVDNYNKKYKRWFDLCKKIVFLVIFKNVLISLLHSWNGCCWDLVRTESWKIPQWITTKKHKQWLNFWGKKCFSCYI